MNWSSAPNTRYDTLSILIQSVSLMISILPSYESSKSHSSKELPSPLASSQALILSALAMKRIHPTQRRSERTRPMIPSTLPFCFFAKAIMTPIVLTIKPTRLVKPKVKRPTNPRIKPAMQAPFVDFFCTGLFEPGI